MMNFSSVRDGYKSFIEGLIKNSGSETDVEKIEVVKLSITIAEVITSDQHLKILSDEFIKTIEADGRIRGDLDAIVPVIQTIIPIIIGVGILKLYNIVDRHDMARLNDKAMEKMIKEYKMKPDEAAKCLALLNASTQHPGIKDAIKSYFEKIMK